VGGRVGEPDEVDDVVFVECTSDESASASATIEITNNSSRSSDYWIEVAFDSADGMTQIGTGRAFISALGPGQRRIEEISTFEEVVDQAFTCRLSSVDRHLS